MCLHEFEEYNNGMRGYEGSILADECVMDTCGWSTHLNNNLIVFGPSGAGKSRGVIGPNIMQLNSSYVVIDPKGALYEQYAPGLAEAGYDVQYVDFAHPSRSTHSWDPFDRCHEERDLDELGWLLMTAKGVDIDDTFWQVAGSQLVVAVARLCEEESGRATMGDVLEHIRLLTVHPENEHGPGWSQFKRASGRCRLDELFEKRAINEVVRERKRPKHLDDAGITLWELCANLYAGQNDLRESHAYDLWAGLRIAAQTLGSRSPSA